MTNSPDGQRGADTSLSNRISLAFAAIAATTRLLVVPSMVFGQTVVTGRVIDSISGRPLAQALVQLVGATDALASRRYTVRSDSIGRFRLDTVAAGRYFAGFYHPVADSMGIDIQPRLIEIGPDKQTVDLATPSALTMLGVMCNARRDQVPAGALVIGHVRQSGDLGSITGALVHFEWSEPERNSRGELSLQDRVVDAKTNSDGWFAVCGIPTDVHFVVRARHATDSTGNLALTLGAGEVRQLTLYIGHATTLVHRTQSDSSSTPWRRGLATLKGRALDAHGQPVDNARATVWDTGIEAVTNGAGAFVLDSLPAGTHTLELKKIGLTALQSIVHLADGDTTRTDFRFEDKPVVLSAVLTRAEMEDARKLAVFEQHRTKATTGGHYITPRDIKAAGGLASVTLLIQGLPGIKVYRNGPVRRVEMVRDGMMAGTKSACTADIYVDGIRSFNDLVDIENELSPDKLAAIEVYARATQRPPEFPYSPTKPCGAVAIWTKTPKPPALHDRAESRLPSTELSPNASNSNSLFSIKADNI
jgi:hypothetical protein